MTAGPPSRPPTRDRPQGPSLTAAPTGSRLNIIIGAAQSGATNSEDAMRKTLYVDQEHIRDEVRCRWRRRPRQLEGCPTGC